MKIYEDEKRLADAKVGQLSDIKRKLFAREEELAARRQRAERHTTTLKREDEAIEVGDLRIIEMLESSPSRLSGESDSLKYTEARANGGECPNCSVCS